MLFQVLAPLTGQIVFQTEHETCIPNENILAALKKAGYKTKKSESKKITTPYRDWGKTPFMASETEVPA